MCLIKTTEHDHRMACSHFHSRVYVDARQLRGREVVLSRAHFTLSSVSLSNTVRCLWFFMLSQSGFSTKQVDDDDANVKLKPHFGTSSSIPKTSMKSTFSISIIGTHTRHLYAQREA